ncbi:MAG: UPF0158 family protein [Candidatus Methylumidiphilus sp.]
MPMPTLKYSDLLFAFDFASAGFPGEARAYIAIDTGAIYFLSEYTDSPDDMPEDVETSDRYIQVPHKNHLNLSRRLALRFAAEKLPDDGYASVADIFQRKGAYRRFKDYLDEIGQRDEWYQYEAEKTRQALCEWCEDNAIELIDLPTQD